MLVAGPRARVLVDMGFSQRRAVADLAAQHLLPGDLDALLVTHTHGDHVGQAALKFCWRHQVPLVAAAENFAVLRRRFAVMGRLDRAGLLRDMTPHGLHINGLEVRPFAVPHDAEGVNLGYHMTLSSGNGDSPLHLVMATDLGHVTPSVLKHLATANLLVLESNHDPTMLAASGRPAYLIERIAGAYGHLSNGDAARTVETILEHAPPGRLQRVVLVHLSQECNERRIALGETRRVLKELDTPAPKLQAAHQDEPLVILSGRHLA
ncbi:MAG: MBL fold metallo-hydrolase [Anaerolineaceae bacterium]|nr:MBL fold metallo-hydrolase [Anaerolineaceae bacterium]